MEFEDEHDEEEEEEDDDDEGQQITIPPPLQPPPLAPPSYDSSGRGPHFSRVNSDRLIRSGHVTTRYRECLKNHAVSIGSHALDGCGEFMPAGDEGTLHALKCAACNCHRNFHRKETITTTSPSGVGTFYYRTPEGYFHAPPRHVAHASTSPGTHSGEIDDSGGGNMTASMKKRFRTKFTQEQKEKLAGFAERLGWRIQKEDEEAVKEFCDEIQIKRKVLKVWMHNNKNTLGKKP